MGCRSYATRFDGRAPGEMRLSHKRSGAPSVLRERVARDGTAAGTRAQGALFDSDLRVHLQMRFPAGDIELPG